MINFYWRIFRIIVLAILLGSIQVRTFGYSSIDSLSKLLLTNIAPLEKASVLLALSHEIEGSNPQQSVEYANKALSIASKEQNEELIINSKIRLSNGLLRLGKLQESFEYAQQAFHSATSNNLNAEAARARSILSLIYNDLGDFDKSSQLDFENIKYYESIGDIDQVGLVKGNIGVAFINQRNFDRGLEYLRESFEVALKTNDLNGMAYQYNNIAGVYYEYYQDHQTALEYYKKALQINDKIGDKRQEAIYEMNIASCFSKLDQKDSALFYYNNSIHTAITLGDQALLANILTYLGEFQMKIGDVDKSIQSGKEAFSISTLNNYKEWIMASSGFLHHAYLAKKDTLNAYRYAIIHFETKDELQKIQSEHELFKLEFQYNSEKMERERQIAVQRKDAIMFFVIFCLVTGLVIILLLFSRHRNKSRIISLEKDAIGKELDFKNNELTINLMALMKKNEMLSEISNKLNEVEKGAKRAETREAIRKISREIRRGADDKMLNEFSQRFQEVHIGFYDTLLAKFPTLTHNELKLCAYLRLNMSSKDISELTNQRIETIEHARYRLRRKLGITNSDTNLVNFLTQI